MRASPRLRAPTPPCSIMRLPRLATLLTLTLTIPADVDAQAAPAQRPPDRAIRRDIPMPNGIRRAHAAGTRDSTGRPGRAYWQLRTDYTINVSLDPSTQRLTGRESIILHNTSPDSLSEIVLRLDPNVFIGTNPGAAPWVPAELTDGMIITRMSVDGRAVDLAPPQGPRTQR